MHCKSCDGSKINTTLSTKKIREVLDSAKEMGIRILYLTGGEPLMSEDIFEIIEYAHKCKLHINMITNGTLINERVVDKLLEAGLNNISLSLDGTEDINDSIRGSGVYEKVIRAMEIFQKKRLSRMVSILFTISKINYMVLPEVLDIIRKYGVRKIYFNVFDISYISDNIVEKREMFWISGKDINCFEEILQKAETRANEIGISFPAKDYLKRMVNYFRQEKSVLNCSCIVPETSIIIEATGEVKGCWKMGTDLSIYDHSLLEISESLKYKSLIDNARKLKCKGCVFACYSEEKYLA